MSGMVRPLGWRPLLNNLKRYRPEGKAGREDLRGPSNICRLNRKLQRQVTAVGHIGRGDSQRGQDVFDGSGADSQGNWRSWVMAQRKTERNPLFAGRWFEGGIILLSLLWYFRFKLSYRDLAAILGEQGLSISHSTILRWVVCYADTCEKRWY